MTATVFTDVLVYDPASESGATGPADVVTAGQRIAAVGAGARRDAPPDARVVRGNGHHLLLPGLINAHFHSPANHLKGWLPSQPLELFMLDESPADESLRPTPREAYLRTMLGAVEMLRGGVTAVQDDAFFMPEPDPDVIDAVLRAYADSGIRASVALDQPEVPEAEKLPRLDTRDRVVKAALQATPTPGRQELLALYDHLVTRWHGAEGGRLTAAVSVSAPQRVTVEYFEALDDLSRRHGLPLFAHMLETKLQRTLLSEQPRFAGRSLVRYTADLGLLSERMNVIHAVWVDDADISLLAASGATVAHNPVSNLRLGSGVMPFRKLRDAGVPIALGVDEAICSDAVDLWSVVRAAGLVHNLSGDASSWPGAGEVLECLWAGGARALLREDKLGTVRPGALADLTLVDLHALAFTPLNDLRGQLVYCAAGTDTVLTMVDGVVVVEAGRLTLVDEVALLAEAREVFARKLPALQAVRAATARLRPHYTELVRRAAATDVGLRRRLEDA